MLVKRDQRAKRCRIEIIAQHRRTRPVAREAPRRIIAGLAHIAARHQSRALGKAIGQQNLMMRRIEVIPGRNAGDKINRHQMRALMQKLEHRVLSIGARPAPSDRRCWAINRLSRGSDAFAIALHLELLKIVRQKLQAFIISKAAARLTAAYPRVIKVRKGRAQAQILAPLGLGKMRIDRGGARQNLRKLIPANRQGQGETNARPQ